MSEEDAFAAYAVHPDTNRQAFEALMAECMDDLDYAATMKVIGVIMREES